MKNILIKISFSIIISSAWNLCALAQQNLQPNYAKQLRLQGGLQSKYPALKATLAHEIARTGDYQGNEIDLLIKCLDDYTKVRLAKSFTDSSITFSNIETTPYDEARNALVKIGKPAVDKLISAVKSDSSDYGIGYKSAECLGLIGDKKALPVLIQSINNGKIGGSNTVGGADQIPIAAARIGKKDVTNELLLAYDKAKTSDRLSDGLIYALGYSQDERCIPILRDIIEGNDRFKKFACIHALGYLKSKKAIPILVDRLKDEDLFSRWYSCEAIAEIGDKTALPYLNELIKTEKESVVRDAANEAIKRLEK